MDLVQRPQHIPARPLAEGDDGEAEGPPQAREPTSCRPRRGLFAGSIVTLVLILGLGTLAFLGWQQFFTEFHRIFFADGTWTFSMDDTLIRLFPGQFWIDAGMVIAALVLLTALLTLILTWPTRRRRGLVKDEPVPAAGQE